ncbi:MAG: hypothetical protein KC435_08585 [Thermomicrobiales bacterium]|nr:hypothetical protein [Thermomicrobiales bacterium]
MNSLMNGSVGRFICPALAVVIAIVAAIGPWFVIEHTRTTSDSTLLEIMRGEGIVEYTSQRWLWISGVGLLLVIASALVGADSRKKLAQAGAYLMVVLPGWSLANIYIEDQGYQAGWALWVVVVLAVAIILLASRIPEPEEALADALSDQVNSR